MWTLYYSPYSVLSGASSRMPRSENNTYYGMEKIGPKSQVMLFIEPHPSDVENKFAIFLHEGLTRLFLQGSHARTQAITCVRVAIKVGTKAFIHKGHQVITQRQQDLPNFYMLLE